MRTFFNLTFLLFFLNSCTSQTLNTQFINSISTSVKKKTTTTKQTQGKISITYPNNLSAKFQKIISDYILIDMKLVPCDGADAQIQVRYEIKYNSDNIVSILKVVDYVFCSDRDYTEWDPFLLYVNNGIIYKVSIDETTTTKRIVDNFIKNSISNPINDCNYNYADINKYILIDDKQVKLLLVQDNLFCFSELNLNLQAEMIKLDIIN